MQWTATDFFRPSLTIDFYPIGVLCSSELRLECVFYVFFSYQFEEFDRRHLHTPTNIFSKRKKQAVRLGASEKQRERKKRSQETPIKRRDRRILQLLHSRDYRKNMRYFIPARRYGTAFEQSWKMSSFHWNWAYITRN